MFVVLGATGHVGSATANALLEAGEAVTVISHGEDKAASWKARGAEVAVADVGDPEALRAVFRQAKRAFLLNPPADVSTDTDAEEHRTAAAIVAALDGSGLEKVVAESAYGAQAGDRVGDLSVLFDFEQALARQPIPVTVLRAAYYMSNWDALLPSAREGVLPTMYPADLKIPMVAPADLGAAAARFPREPVEQTGARYVEGPERYSSRDVAEAFSQALGKPVELSITPRAQWEEAYRKLGFSVPAAASYTRMTEVSVDSGFQMPDEFERGSVALTQYIRELVGRSAARAS